MRGPLTRRILPALSSASCSRPPPHAATTDRVQVGREGQNATAGYPVGLYMSVTLLRKNRALGGFDGESRNWEGPRL